MLVCVVPRSFGNATSKQQNDFTPFLFTIFRNSLNVNYIFVREILRTLIYLGSLFYCNSFSKLKKVIVLKVIEKYNR